MNEPYYMSALAFDPVAHLYRYEDQLVPNITLIVPSDYSHVHPQVLERKRIIGQRAHQATEYYDKGCLNWSALDKITEGYLAGWVSFFNDYECEVESDDVERRLYHPIDRYAGTGDRPRIWLKPPGHAQRRRLSCLEIKTIAKMDEAPALQTAGQQRAENHRARALGIQETEDRWAVQLKPDGKYKAFHYTDKRHERVFLAYLVTVQWELAVGKRKLGK